MVGAVEDSSGRGGGVEQVLVPESHTEPSSSQRPPKQPARARAPSHAGTGGLAWHMVQSSAWLTQGCCIPEPAMQVHGHKQGLAYQLPSMRLGSSSSRSRQMGEL